MRKWQLRFVSLLLALFMTTVLFAGCQSAKTQETGKAAAPAAATPAAPAATAASTQAAKPAGDGSVYPLKGDVTLKYWMLMHANWSGFAKNFGETEIAKEVSKRTGVKIEYIHPPLGQDKDVFNIMIASGDYPDLIEYKWVQFPGGPAAAINNGIIIKLNDVFDKYAPNLKKYLASKPQYDKEAKLDDGTYYFFPFLRDGKELLNTSGAIIRKDWLDDLKLPVPETMDEWYNMLKAFKERKGAAAPLTAIGDKNAIQVLTIFEGGFNTKNDFHIKDGKIQYGYMDPGYKDELIFLNKLYNEGLLDKNFAATDTKARDANMLNGKSGATYGAGGGQMGVWLTTMKEKDPKYDLVAAKFPVQKKGDKITVGNQTTGMDRNTQVAISTKCKNIEAAARFLDYGYSAEGKEMYNFGIEGVSYNKVNGVPTYSDTVMKNPDKLTVAQAISKYARGNMSGPFAQDPAYILQYYALQQQKDALKIWSDHEKAAMYMLTPTSEESAEMAKIMNDVDTYVREMLIKFVMGTEPISNFDKYIDQLKKMNIERAIQLQQQALDRFNKR